MDAGFAPGVAEHLHHYVYALCDPTSGARFYIGKGTGDRCFEHIAVAQTSTRDHTREFEKLERIRRLTAEGSGVAIEILRHGLDEQTALEIEATLIELLGLRSLTNAVAGQHQRARGRMSVEDLNALYGAKPIRIDDADQLLLIRISRKWHPMMTANDLYEATRKYWRVSQRWTEPSAPRSPTHVLSVAEGVVRAAYRIDHWEPASDQAISEDPVREGRLAMSGKRDLEMEARCLGRDVTEYLPTGNQNPVTYVNCAQHTVS